MQKIAELFDLSKTVAADLFAECDYGYQVLPRIKEYILALGATLDAEEFDNPRPTVWIARDAVVAPTAYIGDNVIIDHGAGLYTWYCGLSDVKVERGNYVRTGETVGTAGQTGLGLSDKNGFMILATWGKVAIDPQALMQ